VPQYRLAAGFNIDMRMSGPADPLPAEVFPSQGKSVYEQSCSACHSLGEYDKSEVNASDLSMRGGELPLVYPGSVSQHRDIGLDDQSIQALRIFLNVW
jgi:mono/diheme cytochrome c family protein